MAYWLKEWLHRTALWQILEWIADWRIFAERRKITAPVISKKIDLDHGLTIRVVGMEPGRWLPIGDTRVWNKIERNSRVTINFLVSRIKHRYILEDIQLFEAK